MGEAGRGGFVQPRALDLGFAIAQAFSGSKCPIRIESQYSAYLPKKVAVGSVFCSVYNEYLQID